MGQGFYILIKEFSLEVKWIDPQTIKQTFTVYWNLVSIKMR